MKFSYLRTSSVGRISSPLSQAALPFILPAVRTPVSLTLFLLMHLKKKQDHSALVSGRCIILPLVLYLNKSLFACDGSLACSSSPLISVISLVCVTSSSLVRPATLPEPAVGVGLLPLGLAWPCSTM